MTHQLSCGHWQSEPARYPVGAPLSCPQCGSLRTTVIGYAVTP